MTVGTMSRPLSAEEERQYASLIDAILAAADLETISRKKIRLGLEAALGGKDLTACKSAIKDLIEARFDVISCDTVSTFPASVKDTSNDRSDIGSATPPTVVAEDIKDASSDSDAPSSNTTSVVPSSVTTPSIASPVKEEEPALPAEPNKKKPKLACSMEDLDAKLAAKLQAQENSLGRGRTTRGAANGRFKPNVKPSKGSASRKKLKSSKKVRAEDDSDIEQCKDDSSSTPKLKSMTGFHKPFNLSPALTELCGSSQLSRTEVVSKLWEYIKRNERQDPSNKKLILCDDKLLAVFRNSKIDMFSMNKTLSSHLWPIEEDE